MHLVRSAAAAQPYTLRSLTGALEDAGLRSYKGDRATA
jgi:hypothetical protein